VGYAYKILVGNPEGKRSLRRPRHRWKDNIRMDLKKLGLEVADSMHLAQVRDWWQTLVNVVLNLWVP
jgi:hypothetical protein